MVARAEQWRWSSYAGYRSPRAALAWVTYERVLGEFGGDHREARRRCCRFVCAGLADPPRCPWVAAVGGLLVGSQSFLSRVRQMLGQRPADPEIPQVERLRASPSLDEIMRVVAGHCGSDGGRWSPGQRSDAIDRAVAAYLARQRFGYPMAAIAGVLGYRGYSSVRTAVARVESAGERLKPTLAALENQLTNA